jgi:hypothetical protein
MCVWGRGNRVYAKRKPPFVEGLGRVEAVLCLRAVRGPVPEAGSSGGRRRIWESWEGLGLFLCLAGLDDFAGIVVKLLESLKDVTDMNGMIDLGDDVWVPA